jgi:hypothetical protein
MITPKIIDCACVLTLPNADRVIKKVELLYCIQQQASNPLQMDIILFQPEGKQAATTPEVRKQYEAIRDDRAR